MERRSWMLTVAFALIAAVTAAWMLTREPGGSLPEDYLGRWHLTGSGGGLDGGWTQAEPGGYMVITAANEFEYYDEGGALLRTEPFDLSRGASIFNSGEAWILNEGNAVPQVIVLHADGTLSISDNVYDGFGASYARER